MTVVQAVYTQTRLWVKKYNLKDDMLNALMSSEVIQTLVTHKKEST